eukprot:834165-Amorphochlora_amoeboformis.AAC.1
MGSTTAGTWVLKVDCNTRWFLGWVLRVHCVTWRGVMLCYASSKPRYYRVLLDETIFKNQQNLQRSPAICSK